jgi:hypothetical protein
MKAPSTLPLVEVEQLRKIFTDLGHKLPHKKEEDNTRALVRLATVLTARQSQYDRSPKQMAGVPVRLTNIFGDKYDLVGPLWPPGESVPDDWGPGMRAFGHPHWAKSATWRDQLQDLADELRGTLGRPALGKQATARILKEVIPLVTGEKPEVKTIQRELYRQAQLAKAGHPHRRERLR